MSRNDPKFSDRLVWTNSVVPDQTAPLYVGKQCRHRLDCSVCHSVCIFWTQATLQELKDDYSNFSGVRIFRNTTVIISELSQYLLFSIFSPYHFCLPKMKLFFMKLINSDLCV